MSARGAVVRAEGHHPDGRRWVTWRTFVDGECLGNAYTEAEGWRWVADVLRQRGDES